MIRDAQIVSIDKKPKKNSIHCVSLITVWSEGRDFLVTCTSVPTKARADVPSAEQTITNTSRSISYVKNVTLLVE